MNKKSEEKRKDTIKMIFLFLLIAVGPILIWYNSAPFEEKVWFPQNATIANYVNHSFVHISEIQISGTASKIWNFDEYKNSFNGSHNMIYIIDSSEYPEIYYITKLDDKTYYHREKQGAFSRNSEISTTKNSIKVKYQRSMGGVVFWSFMWIIIIIVIILKTCLW